MSLLSASWRGELYLDSSCLNIESSGGSLSTLSCAVSNPFGILLYKPLYGTRDAPMRWYCKLAEELTRYKFYPTRTDCCVFCRYRLLGSKENGYFPDAKYTVTAIVMIRVDDIVYSGTVGNLNDLKQCLSQFQHGPWESLSESSGLVFCGIRIDLKPGRIIESPQRDFYPKIVARRNPN